MNSIEVRVCIGLLFISTLVQFIHCNILTDDIDDNSAEKNNDFDLLIFTQRWPVTSCMEWIEKANHTCVLPSPKEIWTIHGIWPSRYNNSNGPFFCNKTMKFNITMLNPFITQLEQFWVNIEKETKLDSLWEHEWLKHGTCAAQKIPNLSTEIKYFGQGLSWLQQYTMSSILSKGSISPDQSNLTALNIHLGIRSVIEKNAIIHCIHDAERNETYLAEIRICFSKEMELMDCDGIRTLQPYTTHTVGGYTKVLTNCKMDRLIIYPSVVPPATIKRQTESVISFWQTSLVNFYKVFKMMTWF